MREFVSLLLLSFALIPSPPLPQSEEFLPVPQPIAEGRLVSQIVPVPDPLADAVCTCEPVDYDKIRLIVKQELAKVQPVAVKDAPKPSPEIIEKPAKPSVAPLKSIVVGPVSNGSYSGSSKWTYPGDIASHLQSTHGQKVDGMTKAQMEALHDRLHDSASTVRPMQTRNFMPMQNCPGGICPTNRQPSRVWFPLRRR